MLYIQKKQITCFLRPAIPQICQEKFFISSRTYICEIDYQGQFYYNTNNNITSMAEPEGSSNQVLKNRLIYNFTELASDIAESSTHPHIFKLPIMPEMDDI